MKTFDRLQIVRDRNSSYFGSNYRSCTLRQMFWSFQPAFDEGLVDDYLSGGISEFTSLPCFHWFSHQFEVPLHVTSHV